MIIKKGTTDVSIYVNLVDSAAGTPETGLTITNIDATYTRNRAAAVKNDLTALGAANSAHADNQGIEVDATNAPGLYRVDFPDAAFATGVDKVILSVTCTGCAPVHLIVELVDYNSQDAVRLGLTALPNAAAEAAGGLFTRGTGAGQINQADNGQIDANTVAIAGSTAAATTQKNAMAIIVTGTAITGTLSTTQMTTDLTEGTDEHFRDRWCIFRTGNLAGQSARISAYLGSSKLITFNTALTEAPANGDAFEIY